LLIFPIRPVYLNDPFILGYNQIPYTVEIAGQAYGVHFLLETLAFLAGFRYYLWLRKNQSDVINSEHRLWIILGATLGALLGSRIVGILENPVFTLPLDWVAMYQSKTIVGGLLGGLWGVELTKKIIGEQQSSGDLFVFPLILGMIIGRIGCWLTGVLEPTYGLPTDFFLGMDLGDGVMRHPTALYEILFLLVTWLVLARVKSLKLKSGSLFKLFMLSYFFFRLLIEFIKPVNFEWLGLSTIQWSCLVCFVYYREVFIYPKSLTTH